jgi:hypothetical protein
LGEHLDSSRCAGRTAMIRSTTAALGAAALLAVSLGAAPAQADDLATPAPTNNPIEVIISPPPETNPAPSDPSTPGTDPAPNPVPEVPGVPDPGTQVPPVQQPEISGPAAPPAAPAGPSVGAVSPAAPVAVPGAPAGANPAQDKAGVVPPVVPGVPAQAVETGTPSPEPTPSESTAAAAPSKTPAPEPTLSGPVSQAAPVIQAAVVAATGSPLGVQLATVLILLGAGFAYFRVLGAKGTRAAPKAGK